MPEERQDDKGIVFDDQPDDVRIRDYYDLPPDEAIRDQYQLRVEKSGQKIDDAENSEREKRSPEESLALLEGSAEHQEAYEKLLAEFGTGHIGPMNRDDLLDFWTSCISNILEKSKTEITPEQRELLDAYTAITRSEPRGVAVNAIESDDSGNSAVETDQSASETEEKDFLEQKVGDVMQYVHWLSPDMKLDDIDLLDLISIPCYLRITMEQFEQWGCKSIAKEIKEDIKIFNRILQYKIPNAEEMGITVELEKDEDEEENETTNLETDSSDSQDKIARRDRLYKALYAKISEAENMLDRGERDQAIDCLTRVDEMRMTLELEEDDRSVMVLGRTAVGLYKSGEREYSTKYLEEATEMAKKSENSAYLLLFLAACYTFIKNPENATAILENLPDAERSRRIIEKLVSTEDETDDVDGKPSLPLAA